MNILHVRLINALTEYDRKQAKKRGYNPYALGHYMRAAGEVKEAIEGGMEPRAAIVANFTGRLLDAVLKGCQMEKASDAECRG